jgi:hypothetical protein
VKLPSAAKIVALHDEALANLTTAVALPVRRPDPRAAVVFPIFEDAVLAEHEANTHLWALEDEARRPDAPDSTIAQVKRAIDAWNQRRNDLIERLDEDVLAALPFEPDQGLDVPRHSETFGMIVDRLSILALKIHHTGLYVSGANRAGDTDLAAECGARLAILREQRDDLVACLDALVADCAAGRRYFRVYRQFKAYNDPRLNPAIRR